MRLILSILMIIASIAGLVFFIVPQYSETTALRAQAADYETILTNARTLKQQTTALTNKYDSFDPTDITKLGVMLPANPENVKLIIELNAIARQYGMVLQNVKIEDPAADPATTPRVGAPVNNELGTLIINFSVAGPYGSFTNFIKTIEKSLRILEVQKVSFAASDPKTQNYQYTVSLKTYWLK